LISGKNNIVICLVAVTEKQLFCWRVLIKKSVSYIMSCRKFAIINGIK